MKMRRGRNQNTKAGRKERGSKNRKKGVSSVGVSGQKAQIDCLEFLGFL